MSASSFRMALDVKQEPTPDVKPPKVSPTTVNLDALLRSKLAKVRKSVNRLFSFTNWLLPWLQLSDEVYFIDRLQSWYLLGRIGVANLEEYGQEGYGRPTEETAGGLEF